MDFNELTLDKLLSKIETMFEDRIDLSEETTEFKIFNIKELTN